MKPDDPTVEHTWTARSVRPVILLYVAAVFIGFMAFAHFVVHSKEAVVALGLAAFGSMVALTPDLLGRIEYRLTEEGLEKRRLRGKETKEFKKVFTWDEVSHLTPTGAGFKFFKRTGLSGFWNRFWKLHFSDEYSGEIHLEPEDRLRIERVFEERVIPTSKPPKPGRIKPTPPMT